MDEHEELYPLDPFELTPEIGLFKDVLRRVVYATRNVYFDTVRDTPGGTGVMCNLWTLEQGDEWQRWYSIDKVLLRQMPFEALVDYAQQGIGQIRRGNEGMQKGRG